MRRSRTLYDKIWDQHVVADDDGDTLIYIDLHLLHEVTSPQAFSGLKASGRGVRQPFRTMAMADHNVPTVGQLDGTAAIADPDARAQLSALYANAEIHDIQYFAMGDPRNGIVHVVGPEQGRTQPGMTIVCGDSHTSTHGAFGALAFGIGTSEIEHVLATQTLRQRKSRNLRVTIKGHLGMGVSAKDLALQLVATIGVDGAVGHVIEYSGEVVRNLPMEGRMTLCNMSIEAGARSALIAPDETTFDYLMGRPGSPQGRDWDAALERWKNLSSDDDAQFDSEIMVDASIIEPMVSWGTNPAQVVSVGGRVPDPSGVADTRARAVMQRALSYMGLYPGEPVAGIPIDKVFIGSCTNGRIEDLREAAAIVTGRRVAPNVRAMIVAGSGLVRREAEAEGLDRIFIESGFEWREPGCSMCAAMNADRLLPGERCASTSNRNFENRQGQNGRTHLMGPAMAAAAAIAGQIVDARDFRNNTVF